MRKKAAFVYKDLSTDDESTAYPRRGSHKNAWWVMLQLLILMLESHNPGFRLLQKENSANLPSLLFLSRKVPP